MRCAIYRHLIREAEGTAEGGERVGKWRGRLAELEAGAIGAASVAVAGARTSVPPRAAGGMRAPAATARKETAPTPAPALASQARASLVIREPVRSGQVVYAEGRDLIVMAPVHSGAQVMADGNIHVYAPLKGRAIAGAQGARDAQVFCLALEAELVGVDAGYVASDDIAPEVWGGPARVFLDAAGACAVVALGGRQAWRVSDRCCACPLALVTRRAAPVLR